jgi:hypothetical protein
VDLIYGPLVILVHTLMMIIHAEIRMINITTIIIITTTNIITIMMIIIITTIITITTTNIITIMMMISTVAPEVSIDLIN